MKNGRNIEARNITKILRSNIGFTTIEDYVDCLNITSIFNVRKESKYAVQPNKIG